MPVYIQSVIHTSHLIFMATPARLPPINTEAKCSTE